MAPANVSDGNAGPAALPDNPGEVFAGKAYRGRPFRDAIHAKCGTPRIIATAMWGPDEREALAWLEAWNQPIHRVHGRIEKIFGTWKRSYNLRRRQSRDLARASNQVRLTAIAYSAQAQHLDVSMPSRQVCLSGDTSRLFAMRFSFP